MQRIFPVTRALSGLQGLLNSLQARVPWCSGKIPEQPRFFFKLNLKAQSVLLYSNSIRYSVMFHTPLRLGLMQQRLFAIALLSAAACAQGETWVVTDHAHPVTSTAEHRVIVLDEQQRLEAHLTSRLPSDQTQAGATIKAYLASPEGTRLQHELTVAQQGITDAWSVGVEKIPAVVVDRQYVVYGESDVDKAINLIHKARSAQQ